MREPWEIDSEKAENPRDINFYLSRQYRNLLVTFRILHELKSVSKTLGIMNKFSDTTERVVANHLGICLNNCNNLIYITVYFGQDYNILSKEINGGKFAD